MTTILLLILLFTAAVFFFAWSHQDKLVFFPEKLTEDFTFSFRDPFEEIVLSTSDGEKSYGLYFRSSADATDNTVLFFHGNAGSLRSWGGISEDFLPLGWNVLVMDYRGYGKNTGTLSETSMYSDAELWLDYLRDRKKIKDSEIVVYGRSIGTGVATELVSKHPDLNLFLETPFTDLPSLAKIYYPFLKDWMFRFRFKNLEKLTKIRSKTVIFHGTDDEIIPFEHSEIIFKKLKELNRNAEFHVVPGGSHNNLSAFPEYHRALKKSLDEIRRGRSDSAH